MISAPYFCGAVLSGSNYRLTNSGSATSEGRLKVSANGKYLTLAGYDAPAGVAGIVATTSASSAASPTRRVIGRIEWGADPASAIDTTTGLLDVYDKNNIRSAVTTDGTEFWTGGAPLNSGAASTFTTAGVRYALLGASSSVRLSPSAVGSVSNVRVVDIYAGRLYVSANSLDSKGVNQFEDSNNPGTIIDLPRPTADDSVKLVRLPGLSDPPDSAYDFYFADANTLYVAYDDLLTDANNNKAGGIRKFVLEGGLWNFKYVIQTGLPGTSGVRALTGTTDGAGNAVLYAITNTTVTNIVTVSDPITATTAPGGQTFTTIATSAANTAFRGIAFLPAAASATLSGTFAITDASGSTKATEVTVEFRTPGTLNAVFTKTFSAIPGASYTLSGLTPGTYDLAYKGSNTLRSVLPSVAVTGSVTQNIELRPGDATGDNQANFDDFQVLADAYFTQEGVDALYEVAADFNLDSQVNFDDFLLLAAQYFLSGDD